MIQLKYKAQSNCKVLACAALQRSLTMKRACMNADTQSYEECLHTELLISLYQAFNHIMRPVLRAHAKRLIAEALLVALHVVQAQHGDCMPVSINTARKSSICMEDILLLGLDLQKERWRKQNRCR